VAAGAADPVKGQLFVDKLGQLEIVAAALKKYF
jgi:hypothetical protein